ncbi:MAG: deoxynucleoside kinase [Bacteroidetes bacterium]|nr:deoxynucleoside kinase [Bacteroidota bacterium]
MQKEVSSYNYDTYVFNSKTIAVIGVDGSGKSTCFRLLFDSIKYKNTAAIGDEVMAKKNDELFKINLWQSRLKLFLGPRIKKLKNRKLYRIFKFLELVLRAKLLYKIDSKYAPELILTDGSPLINILGWGHYYCPEIYSKELLIEVIGYMTGNKIPKHRKAFFKKHSHEVLLINRLRIKFHIPDEVFFLKVSPDVAIKRISHRNEDLQPHETRDFLNNLQESYAMVCQLLKENKIHYVDTDNRTPETIIGEMVTILKRE